MKPFLSVGFFAPKLATNLSSRIRSSVVASCLTSAATHSFSRSSTCCFSSAGAERWSSLALRLPTVQPYNRQALDIESPTLVLDSWCPPALHCQRTQGAKLGMGRTGVKRGRGLCVASADMYTPSTSKVWNHQLLCGHEHYDLRFDRVIPAFQRALAIACSAPVGPASNAGINENSAAHSWSHVERHGLATGMWALVRAEAVASQRASGGQIWTVGAVARQTHRYALRVGVQLRT